MTCAPFAELASFYPNRDRISPCDQFKPIGAVLFWRARSSFRAAGGAITINLPIAITQTAAGIGFPSLRFVFQWAIGAGDTT